MKELLNTALPSIGVTHPADIVKQLLTGMLIKGRAAWLALFERIIGQDKMEILDWAQGRG
jgi:hypothetical protein